MLVTQLLSDATLEYVWHAITWNVFINKPDTLQALKD